MEEEKLNSAIKKLLLMGFLVPCVLMWIWLHVQPIDIRRNFHACVCEDTLNYLPELLQGKCSNSQGNTCQIEEKIKKWGPTGEAIQISMEIKQTLLICSTHSSNFIGFMTNQTYKSLKFELNYCSKITLNIV